MIKFYRLDHGAVACVSARGDEYKGESVREGCWPQNHLRSLLLSLLGCEVSFVSESVMLQRRDVVFSVIQ